MDRLIFLAPEDSSRATAIALLVLRLLLIAFFVFMAMRNLGGNVQMREDFANWGYPDWFRILTAAMQLTAAALLVHPAVSFYGGALLGCLMVGAIATHLRHDPPAAALSPLIFLVLALAVAAYHRPLLLRGH